MRTGTCASKMDLSKEEHYKNPSRPRVEEKMRVAILESTGIFQLHAGWHTLVALRASSTRSFFSFSSVSV